MIRVGATGVALLGHESVLCRYRNVTVNGVILLYGWDVRHEWRGRQGNEVLSRQSEYHYASRKTKLLAISFIAKVQDLDINPRRLVGKDIDDGTVQFPLMAGAVQIMGNDKGRFTDQQRQQTI